MLDEEADPSGPPDEEAESTQIVAFVEFDTRERLQYVLENAASAYAELELHSDAKAIDIGTLVAIKKRIVRSVGAEHNADGRTAAVVALVCFCAYFGQRERLLADTSRNAPGGTDRVVLGDPRKEEVPQHLVVLLARGPLDRGPAIPVWRGVTVEDADRMSYPLFDELLRAVERPRLPAPSDIARLQGGELDPVQVKREPRIPDAVRELAPSTWGRLSVREAVFAKRYPLLGEERSYDWVTDEFRTPSVCDTFERLCRAFDLSPGKGGSEAVRSPGKGGSEAVLLYALQVCRQIATFTRERNPYLCTVLLVRGAVNPTAARVGYVSWIKLPEPFPFVHSSHKVKAYAGTARSENVVMVVDVESCRLTEIAILKPEVGSHSRRQVFCELARVSQGLVVHIRGNGLVEVYDAADLRIWCDGARWAIPPLEHLWQYLEKFYDPLTWAGRESDVAAAQACAVAARWDADKGAAHAEADQLFEKAEAAVAADPTGAARLYALAARAYAGAAADGALGAGPDATAAQFAEAAHAVARRGAEAAARRVLGSVMSVFDRGGSSILVLTNDAGYQALDQEQHITRVDPLRPLRVERLVGAVAGDPLAAAPTGLASMHIKTELPLAFLAELLENDGAHVLLPDRTVGELGCQIKVDLKQAGDADWDGGASGTGTMAARLLSRKLYWPPGRPHEAGLHPGFVVKVSADRRVYVFVGGYEV